MALCPSIVVLHELLTWQGICELLDVTEGQAEVFYRKCDFAREIGITHQSIVCAEEDPKAVSVVNIEWMSVE